MKTDGKEQGA